MEGLKRREGKREAFISYLDEYGSVKEHYIEIVSLDQFLIKFKTKDNIISLPLARVLKIKERGNERDDTRQFDYDI